MKIEKVVSALPSTLEPDTVYLVRVGTGFDQYVTDSTGAVAHSLNAVSGGVEESSPLSSVGVKTLVRQTVLAGSVDSMAKPNLLVAGAANSVATQNTSTTPALLSFGAGYDNNGQQDFYVSLTSGLTWGNLPDGTNYLYVDLDATTKEVTPVSNQRAPQYTQSGSYEALVSPLNNTLVSATNNTPEWGTLSASSVQPGGYEAWNAFDSNPSGTAWLSYNEYVNVWLKVEFKTPTTVHMYSMCPRGATLTSAPKDWRLEGSNDGVSWVTVDNRAGQTGWTATPDREFVVTNPGTYLIYRVFITANNGFTSYSGIGNLELYTFPPLVPDVGQMVYNISHISRPQIFNGATYDSKLRLCVGECLVTGGLVTAVTTYAYSGRASATVNLVASSINYAMHNIGTYLVAVNASYRLKDGGNGYGANSLITIADASGTYGVTQAFERNHVEYVLPASGVYVISKATFASVAVPFSNLELNAKISRIF